MLPTRKARFVALFLYRLGRLAFRRRRVVALAWLAVLGVTAIGASLGGVMSGDAGSAPGTEAQSALDLVRDRFPGTDQALATARVVFVAPAGKKITDEHATVDRLLADVAGGPQVAGVVSPFAARAVSPDGSTAYATVGYTAPADDLTAATEDRLRDAVAAVRRDGVTVEVGGPVLAGKPKVGGVTEIVGLLLAGLVLLVAFGSVVAAMLGLAVGIDYRSHRPARDHLARPPTHQPRQHPRRGHRPVRRPRATRRSRHHRRAARPPATRRSPQATPGPHPSLNIATTKARPGEHARREANSPNGGIAVLGSNPAVCRLTTKPMTLLVNTSSRLAWATTARHASRSASRVA